MKRRTLVITAINCILICISAVAQEPAGAAEKAQKLEALAKQLNLTPEQKTKLMPILEADAPKLEAIKSNTSLTGMQKLQQLRAVHEQSDPQIKAILSPQQYQQLQQIRQQEIEQAMQRKRAAQPQ